MTLRTLSLGGLEFVESDDLATGQYVTVRTGPGDRDFVNVFLGDFRSFMTQVVNERIDSIVDDGGLGPKPSIWPAARTLTLAGPITGSASFDGSSNFTLQTHIADGALTMAKVAGLQGALDAATSRTDQTFQGTTTLKGDLLPDLDNTHSLGSPEKMWRDVYIGPGSLYINGQKVLEENSGTIQMVADPNQNIAVQTSGSGDIELAPTGTGVIQLKGSVTLLGGSKIRSSNGSALLFDDAVDFAQEVNFTNATHHKSGRTDVWAASDESSPLVMLRTETGSHMGALISHRSGGWFGLRRYNPSTGLIEGELSIKSDRVLFNERELYHTGNLDMASIGYLAAAVTEHGSAAGVDCNNFTAGSKNLVHNANANTPGSSSTHWYVETLLASAGSGVAAVLIQRAWSTSNDELYVRRRSGGSWSTWRRTWNSGNFNPSSKLDSNATAAAAAKWSTARKLTLTGAISGEVSMDGSGDVSLATSVSNLTIANVTGLRADLDSRALSSQTWQRGTSGANLTAFSGDLNTLNGFGAVYALSATNAPFNANILNFGYANYNAQLLVRNSDFRFRTQENGTWQEWLKFYHSGNLDLSDYIGSDRRVLAGNGLTGGGALSSDQTLTLGTPGTLSGSTTNSVTTGSHTHALSANLKAWDALTPSSKVSTGDSFSDAVGTNPLYLSGTANQDVNNLLVGQRALVSTTSNLNVPSAPGVGFWYIESKNPYLGDSARVQTALAYNGTPELQTRFLQGGVWSPWARYWNSENLDPSTFVPTSRSIVAGSGMTGGGALSANRTLTLGTPGTITNESSNEVFTSSHTHALDLRWTPADSTSTYPVGITFADVNAITGITGHTALTVWSSGARAFQIITSATGGTQTPRMWIRNHHTSGGGGGWTEQFELHHSGNFDPANIPTQNSDVLVSKSNAVVGVGIGGVTNGGLANFGNSGVGDVGLVSEFAGGVIRLRPNGRTSSVGQVIVTTSGVTWDGYTLWHSGAFNPDSKADASNSIIAGNGMSGGGTLGASRTLTLGTPSAITLSSTNSVSTSSHTHAFSPGGTTSQYIRGDGSLATFPSIPSGTVTSVSGGNGLSGSVTTSGSISLGTPGTITNSTSNSVTSTSHTHALSISKSDVGLSNVENYALSTWDSNFITDSRGAVRPPSYYDRRYAQWDFQNQADTASSLGTTWHALLTVSPWSTTNTGSHVPQQINFHGRGLQYRYATSDSAWSSWEDIVTGTTSTSDDNNTIAQRNGSGDIYARLFRSTFANGSSIPSTAAVAYRVNNSSDNYIRFCDNSDSVRNWLGVGPTQSVGFQDVLARGFLYCGQGGTTDSSRIYGGSSGNMFIVAGHSASHIYFRPRGWSSTAQAYLHNNGSFYASDYTLSSDRRLKENIRDLEYRGRLRPVNFDWIESGKADFGFIAQEVEPLYPEAVQLLEPGDDETEKTLTLSYPKLTAILSHQVNHVEDELVVLKRQNEELAEAMRQQDGKIERLERLVAELLDK